VVLQTVEVNTKEEEEGTMTCDVGNQGPRWNRHTHVVGLNRYKFKMYLKNIIRARKIADLKPICTGFPSYVYEVMVLVIQLSRGRGRISSTGLAPPHVCAYSI
jgi:hypothetical protein